MPQAAINNLRIVTTSWDDGHISDLKLAELLQSKNIGGTFYIPISPYNGQQSLAPQHLRRLSSEGFEIGAHSFSHKLLWGLPSEELRKEIEPCKPILEDILGSAVRMFCYPRGRYDENVIRALQRAGFGGARTVKMLQTGLDFDPFEMPTSLQAFPHGRLTYFKNAARAHFRGTRACVHYTVKLANWLELGKTLFDSVMEHGGVWHLYGHSWEIADLNLWSDLEDLLDYVHDRKGVIYLCNGELLNIRQQNERRLAPALSAL
jgi:peptidoglycan-N-acetylglucosamine deacetylase